MPALSLILLLLKSFWQLCLVVRALASHQCGPGSNPGVDAICGLSLLLVLSFAPRGFSSGTPVFPSLQKPTLPNSFSIWNERTRLNEFIWTLKCYVGKKTIYNFFYKEMFTNQLARIFLIYDCQISLFNSGFVRHRFFNCFFLIILASSRKHNLVFFVGRVICTHWSFWFHHTGVFGLITLRF